MKENEKYFLAISVRVNGNPNRYFLGLVCRANNKILYDLKVIEKKEIQFECKYAHTTLKKYGVLMHPNKVMVKEWHKALKKYFKGKNALTGWIYSKLQQNYPDVDAKSIDYANVIIGESL